jgi:hypothetical protein
MKFGVLWDVAPCSLVGVDQCFGDAYNLHHQGDEFVCRLLKEASSETKTKYRQRK